MKCVINVGNDTTATRNPIIQVELVKLYYMQFSTQISVDLAVFKVLCASILLEKSNASQTQSGAELAGPLFAYSEIMKGTISFFHLRENEERTTAAITF